MNSLIAVLIALLVAFTIVAVVRVAISRTVFDRILAANYAVVTSVVLIMMVAFAFGRPEMFVDVGLSYALLAFLFPIAFARYLDREEGK
jgi:multicomponent Na+:H+ antiporter subunit F